MEYSKDENKKENENEIDEQNKININYTSDENNNNNNNEESNVENNYNFLKDDKILGRFSLQEKLYNK